MKLQSIPWFTRVLAGTQAVLLLQSALHQSLRISSSLATILRLRLKAGGDTAWHHFPQLQPKIEQAAGLEDRTAYGSVQRQICQLQC